MRRTAAVRRDPRTLGDLLAQVAADRPGAAALTVGGTGERWTAQELLADSGAIAAGLLARFRPGARIATCLPNGPAAVLLQCGAALAGMTLVPVNPRSSAPELEHVLRLTGAAVLFAAPDTVDVPVATVEVDGREWRACLPRGGESALPDVAPDTLAQVQFTSGTTGRPKGVTITHDGMVATAHAFAAGLGPDAGAVWLNPMPLFHTAGNVLGTVAALCARAEHVVLPFAVAPVLRAIGEHRATLLSAAPTLLDLLLSDGGFAAADISSLMVVFTGGMTVTPEFAERVESGFGARLATTFGMTETCGSALLCGPSDPDGARREGRMVPLAGTEARVVAPDGRAVPPGTPGELWLRGARLTRGYLDDPVATAATIDAAGWLHTGDRAEADAEGRFRVVGRIKDMIKTGGENVAPVEVEQVIADHPGVVAAAVVGVPDDRWGELVVAFVVLAVGSAVTVDDLAERCRDRLSPFKVPRRWYAVDALPMTASAKVRRAALRQRAIDYASSADDGGPSSVNA